jgi:hypothetical protein
VKRTSSEEKKEKKNNKKPKNQKNIENKGKKKDEIAQPQTCGCSIRGAE